VTIRLPIAIHTQLREWAEENGWSLNGEITRRLGDSIREELRASA
jgi:hypothetical protein